MKRELAKELYSENWAKDFTTLEDLYTQIKTLAENGCYNMCIYIDGRKKYTEICSILHAEGYELEDYNGGNNNILEITW